MEAIGGGLAVTRLLPAVRSEWSPILDAVFQDVPADTVPAVSTWFQYSPYAVVFFAATVLNASLAVFAVLYGRKRGFDGTVAAFAALLFSGTIWTLTRTVQLSTPELAIKSTMAGLMYVGLGGAIVSGFCFCLAYTGRDRYLSWRTVALLSVVPAIAVGLALTNPEHHLLWETTVLDGDPVYIDRSFQPMYFAYVVYVYLFLLAGAAMVAQMIVRTQGLYRRQSIAVMAGIVSPMSTGLLFTFDAVPLVPNHIDPTPFGFLLLGVLFGYSTFRYRLLDLVPVARETVIEEIDDVIVTIDSSDRIVDCNEAATELFGIDSNYVGMSAADLFDRVSPDLHEQVQGSGRTDGQVSIQTDGEQCHYSLSVSPVDEGRDSEDPARVVVLRDITAIKRREEELDLLRQVQSRVLRHNIRNELTSIRGNAELLADGVSQQYTDRAQAVIGASDSLLSITEKARLVEDIIDHEQDVIEHDLRAVVDEAVRVVRQRYRDAEITVDGPERAPIRASPKLDAAVRNLIENACQHNHSGDPTVLVSIEPTAEGVTLSVSDDGPGIPEQEIQVLEDGEETQLTHGSGVGLWFVKLVTDRSEATLQFDTESSGTEVRIRFENVDDRAVAAESGAATPNGLPSDRRSGSTTR